MVSYLEGVITIYGLIFFYFAYAYLIAIAQKEFEIYIKEQATNLAYKTQSSIEIGYYLNLLYEKERRVVIFHRCVATIKRIMKQLGDERELEISLYDYNVSVK